MKKTIPCPECRGRGFINYSTDNSMCATSCNNCNGTGSLEVTMTNFDRIKAMSVEEMAEMLYEEMESTMCYCDFCEHYKHHAPHCSAPDIQQGCLNAIKKYLESEVQGE